MKRIINLILLCALLIPARNVKAEGEMLKIYLVPMEVVVDEGGTHRGAEYFKWRYDSNPPSIDCRYNLMYYGFINIGLLVAHNITPADHAALILHADVYAFPDNLDQPITDKATIDAFFEAINFPTDWTTPSTTYRELLRKTAGLIQFNQRYGGIAAQTDGLPHSIFDNGRTLDSNWNTLSAQEKIWFEAALASFGFSQGVSGNPKLRSLAKQAGDLWGGLPFYMGGFTF